MKVKNTKKAFLWIINILQKHKIPYQVTGGFAAKIYGSKRKLADIDIPETKFKDIFGSVGKYAIFGPKQYKAEGFDVYLMTLKYKGQLIDISGAGKCKIFDKVRKRWIKTPANLNKFTLKKAFGKKVKVITKKDLISYKSKLRRQVDKIDIADLP